MGRKQILALTVISLVLQTVAGAQEVVSHSPPIERRQFEPELLSVDEVLALPEIRVRETDEDPARRLFQSHFQIH